MSMHPPTRRECIRLAASAALLAPFSLRAGHSVLRESPKVSVQDFASFPSILTPAEDVFVRSHFPAPRAGPSPWQVRVDGLVDRPRVLGMPELSGRPRHSVTAVLECAGNGVGVGAVSCAEWGGTHLGGLIRECGIRTEARFVRLTGSDRGREPDAQTDELAYSRTIPIESALRPEALLVTEMNGAPLAPDHGFPIRFLLAGSYGMNSVKWLERIELLSEPAADFFMVRRFRRVRDEVVGDPVGAMPVKSILVRPKAGQMIRGTAIETGGYAWGGGESIARVEVSLDGLWRPAELLASPSSLAWAPWALRLDRVPAGMHTLAVRAFSAGGQAQPPSRDLRRQDEYELNHYHRIRCASRP